MTRKDFLRLLAIGIIGLLMGLPFVLFALDARERSANVAIEQIAINPENHQVIDVDHQIVEVAISMLLWGGIATIAVTNIPIILVICAGMVIALCHIPVGIVRLFKRIVGDNHD